MSAPLTNAFGRLWNVVQGRTTERNLYVPIPDDRVLDGEKTQVFEEDEAYFSIRLSEMFIRDERVLTRTFIPLSIAVTEFLYDGKKQTVPFIVGNQLLQSIDPYIKGENVEYSNTAIVGPIPYSGGDVMLYIGLYRVQVGDLSRKLLGFLGSILSSFDATGLSKYLDISGAVGSGLADLLGMKEVEFRLGKRDEFTAAGAGPARFKSGYLAYVNMTDSAFQEKDLYVQSGSLQRKDSDKVRRFDEADYCLIKIEYSSERHDVTALGFHRLWGTAKEMIWNAEPDKAKAAFVQLVQELAKSPDLTRKHRFRLLQVYKANFEAELAQSQAVTQFRGEGASSASRGPSSNTRSTARGAIQAATELAKNANASPQAQSGLVELVKNWDGIPHLSDRGKNVDLSDGVLELQVKSLQAASTIVKPDPDALAKALTMAAFSIKAA